MTVGLFYLGWLGWAGCIALLALWAKHSQRQASKIAGLTIQLGHARADLLTEQGLTRIAESNERHMRGAMLDALGKGGTRTIPVWSSMVHERSVRAGFWPETAHGNTDRPEDVWISQQLMLISDELSEAHEALRDGKLTMYLGADGKPEGMVTEIGDAVIRALDLCRGLGLDLEGAMLKKHGYNCTRPPKHGRRF